MGSFAFTELLLTKPASVKQGSMWCLAWSKINLSRTKNGHCEIHLKAGERVFLSCTFETLHIYYIKWTSFALSSLFPSRKWWCSGEIWIRPLLYFSVPCPWLLRSNPVGHSQIHISSSGLLIQLLMKHLCLEISQVSPFHHVQQGA